MLLLMKWMVHLHPGLAAILTGAGDASLSSPAESLPEAPENAVDPACILAALFHIDQNGIYDAPLTRLWPQDFAPKATTVPPGIAFYLLPAPDKEYLPLLIAVALQALDPDLTILSVMQGERSVFPSADPDKNAAPFAASPSQIAAFIALAIKRQEDLENWPEGRENLNSIVIPALDPGFVAAAEWVQDCWLRRAEIASLYAAALQATREDIAGLFNITDSRVERIEKRFTYIMDRLRHNLGQRGATCRIEITFSDGLRLSGEDLDSVR